LTGLFDVVQPPLWEAELAESVTYATRCLPNDPPLGVAAGEAAGDEARWSRDTVIRPPSPPFSWTTVSVPQHHEQQSRVTDRHREPVPSLRP
jgi:hypothetical protein